MTKINIPNSATLENLIHGNLVNKLETRVVVQMPYPSQLNLTENAKNEIMEAAEFIQRRETQAIGNRFAEKDLVNDTTLAEARRVVLDFIEKAQNVYDATIKESNAKFELSDKLQADINKLLHSKKVLAAIEDLRQATKNISERINEIPIQVDLNGHYDKGVISYLALEAVYRLHDKE